MAGPGDPAAVSGPGRGYAVDPDAPAVEAEDAPAAAAAEAPKAKAKGRAKK